MIVEHRTHVSASGAEVFTWHARPGAFERLVPPWERVRLLEPHPGLVPGSQVRVEIGAGLVSTRLVARHAEVEPGLGFTDVQQEGPFARWTHVHRFEPAGPHACDMTDRIDCELKGGPLGELADPFVKRRLLRMLRYRHRIVAGDIAMHARYAGPRLRVVISGASGFLGRALSAALTTGGHDVVRLVRRQAGLGEIQWDPRAGRLEPDALSGADAVVHLAAESLAGSRWTASQKARIANSRIAGTRLIADAAARAGTPPRVFLSASAVGFYGSRGDDLLNESSAPGVGFLPDVARAWEEAAAPASRAGVRTVMTRFGIVLSPAGGMLERVRLPFSLGLGGPLGDGQQWMSWVSRDDAIGAILHCLRTESIQGPVNVAVPAAVRNAEFGTVLGRVLRRPAVLPVPAFALRLAFNGLADEGLLASTRVSPTVLEATGYQFRYADLEMALRHELGRMA